MTFQATVVRVLIASPGDTGRARQIIRDAMEDWNSLHAEDTSVMLLPVMWERDATPEMGDRPQGIINRQLVDVCDVLIGTFWTRLGTPTSEAESGTAEEIERFIKAGKPVLIYFSDEPVVPSSVDMQQYERLIAFRENLQSRGLLDRYSSDEELWRKVSKALTRVMRERFKAEVPDGPAIGSPPRAQLLAQIEREREMTGVGTRGQPRYSTRYGLVIQNNGTAAAEDLTFDFRATTDDQQLPAVAGDIDSVAKLAPGGSLRYPLMVHLGTVSQWEIVMRWREGDRTQEDRQTLRV